MRPDDLLHPTPEGLYCPPGDFHIDPVAQVPNAFVTHGHADHARPGMGHVTATSRTLDIMAIRYGADHARGTTGVEYGEVVERGPVTISFHPAGHVLGSAQIRVECGGTVIVASGDYKRTPDPTCETFEPVPADVFITEATFGLPVFRHPDPAHEAQALLTSLRQFPERAHMVGAYALGKAQRVIRMVRDQGYDEPIFIHGSLNRLCDYYESEGIALGKLRPATLERGKKAEFGGRIIVAPPGAIQASWARRFPDPVVSFASGWMTVRQRARQRGVELPLVLSDHSDWDELTATIREVAPREVWVTHGREEALVRWCELHQIKARPLHLVGYDDEAE